MPRMALLCFRRVRCIWSGARIQRVLNKALVGQSITISFFGGSHICLFPSSFYTPKLTYPPVSACHGAGGDPISPTCYPSCFFQWWNIIFPHPATELTSGALRHTNSGYVGYCNSLHLLNQMDLVIIELNMRMNCAFLYFLLFLSYTSVFFTSVCYRCVATACTLFYAFLQTTDFSTPSKDSLPQDHPICSFILYRGFTPFHIPSSNGHYHLPSPFLPGRVSPHQSNPSPFPICQKHPLS